MANKPPDFVVKDINNEQVRLSTFQNKNFVLLDFWASWCIPCREGFPALKIAYKKFYDKGFEIINISIDQDLQKWKDAITHDSIATWKHVSEEENKSFVYSLYFGIGIPLKVLIDKQGKIVARWLGDGKENEEELAAMLEDLAKTTYLKRHCSALRNSHFTPPGLSRFVFIKAQAVCKAYPNKLVC